MSEQHGGVGREQKVKQGRRVKGKHSYSWQLRGTMTYVYAEFSSDPLAIVENFKLHKNKNLCQFLELLFVAGGQLRDPYVLYNYTVRYPGNATSY